MPPTRARHPRRSRGYNHRRAALTLTTAGAPTASGRRRVDAWRGVHAPAPLDAVPARRRPDADVSLSVVRHHPAPAYLDLRRRLPAAGGRAGPLGVGARPRRSSSSTRSRSTTDPLLDVVSGGGGRAPHPPGMAANPAVRYRVRVIEDPTLNAFAYPHGSLYVHTGLLARMENEDQLATVFGHEMTHVENRHMLRYRAQRPQQADRPDDRRRGRRRWWSRTPRATPTGQGDWAQAATIGVVSGPHRRPRAAARLPRLDQRLRPRPGAGGRRGRLRQDGRRRLRPRRRPPRSTRRCSTTTASRKVEAFFFGSHPRLAERIDATPESVTWRPTPPPARRRCRWPRPARRLHSPHPAGGPRRRPPEHRHRPPQARRDQLDRARARMPDDPETCFLTGRLRLAEATGRPKDRLGGAGAAPRRGRRRPSARASRLDDTRAGAASRARACCSTSERQLEWQAPRCALCRDRPRRRGRRVRGEDCGTPRRSAPPATNSTRCSTTGTANRPGEV